MIHQRRAQGGLLGVAVGEALGLQAALPLGRDACRDPKEGGLPFGYPDYVPADWSENTSLTFCTVEALLGDYSLSRLGELFGQWLQEGYWSSRKGTPSSLEKTTRDAITRITRGVPPEDSGNRNPQDGECGCLARSLPVALAFSRWSIPAMLDKVHEASAVTHAHARHRMACGLYALIYDPEPWRSERRPFRRLIRATIGEVPVDQVAPDGSIARTLEAAVWCLQTTRSFRDCMARALKLPGSGETLVSVTGGLAGVAYGIQAIPVEWIGPLVRKDDLIRISERFAAVVSA
jgi:ADP-ribosyl-[dinitrogen reductase] hydrolase